MMTPNTIELVEVESKKNFRVKTNSIFNLVLLFAHCKYKQIRIMPTALRSNKSRKS